MTGRITGIVALVLAGGAGVVLSMSESNGFPHRPHSRLFPTCLGCHRGIPQGDEERYYTVAPADCMRCHDGQRAPEVDWQGPSRTPSNLVFSHEDHAAEVAGTGEPAMACQGCHGIGSDTLRLAVARALPEICVDCHAPQGPEHLAARGECTACHRTLANAEELSLERIALFPQPPSHANPDFVSEHGGMIGEGGLEACSVCHARESCSRCHLDARSREEILSLPLDPRVASLVSDLPGEWPEPDTHDLSGWEFSHGLAARAEIGECATCHTAPSCRACHGAAAVPAIDALPTGVAGGPSGAVVERTRPPGHTSGFLTEHGVAAAASFPNCNSCHVETECADCHVSVDAGDLSTAFGDADPEDRGLRSGGVRADDPGERESPESLARLAEPPGDRRGGYHPPNFLVRHGAEAFAVQTNCTDCHSTEAFCRDCHASTGISVGVADGAGGAFHDAQPDWLFEHGRAARMGMEACASCHQQTSCLRCHSAQFGLRVNPHGPGFDPGRLSARSTISCGICHRSDQIPPP